MALGKVGPSAEDTGKAIRRCGSLDLHLDARKIDADPADDDLVLGREPKVPFAPSSVGKRGRAAFKAAKVRRISLHECRRTFASLLIAAGVNPKAIQTFMGHATREEVERGARITDKWLIEPSRMLC